MAMIHTQMAKTAPMEPPTQLALYSGKLKEELDVELAAKSLTNFLRSCVAEMVLGAVALGKNDLRAVNREDLCALTPYAAAVTGVAPAYRERMPYRPPATALAEERTGERAEESAGAEKNLQ